MSHTQNFSYRKSFSRAYASSWFGIIESFMWIIISGSFLTIYHSRRKSPDGENSFRDTFYDTYLKHGDKGPRIMQLLMIFCLFLSTNWLTASGWMLYELSGKKIERIKASLMVWASVTIAVCSFDVLGTMMILLEIIPVKKESNAYRFEVVFTSSMIFFKFVFLWFLNFWLAMTCIKAWIDNSPKFYEVQSKRSAKKCPWTGSIFWVDVLWKFLGKVNPGRNIFDTYPCYKLRYKRNKSDPYRKNLMPNLTTRGTSFTQLPADPESAIACNKLTAGCDFQKSEVIRQTANEDKEVATELELLDIAVQVSTRDKQKQLTMQTFSDENAILTKYQEILGKSVRCPNVYRGFMRNFLDVVKERHELNHHKDRKHPRPHFDDMIYRRVHQSYLFDEHELNPQITYGRKNVLEYEHYLTTARPEICRKSSELFLKRSPRESYLDEYTNRVEKNVPYVQRYLRQSGTSNEDYDSSLVKISKDVRLHTEKLLNESRNTRMLCSSRKRCDSNSDSRTRMDYRPCSAPEKLSDFDVSFQNPKNSLSIPFLVSCPRRENDSEEEIQCTSLENIRDSKLNANVGVEHYHETIAAIEDYLHDAGRRTSFSYLSDFEQLASSKRLNLFRTDTRTDDSNPKKCFEGDLKLRAGQFVDLDYITTALKTKSLSTFGTTPADFVESRHRSLPSLPSSNEAHRKKDRSTCRHISLERIVTRFFHGGENSKNESSKGENWKSSLENQIKRDILEGIDDIFHETSGYRRKGRFSYLCEFHPTNDSPKGCREIVCFNFEVKRQKSKGRTQEKNEEPSTSKGPESSKPQRTRSVDKSSLKSKDNSKKERKVTFVTPNYKQVTVSLSTPRKTGREDGRKNLASSKLQENSIVNKRNFETTSASLDKETRQKLVECYKKLFANTQQHVHASPKVTFQVPSRKDSESSMAQTGTYSELFRSRSGSDTSFISSKKKTRFKEQETFLPTTRRCVSPKTSRVKNVHKNKSKTANIPNYEDSDTDIDSNTELRIRTKFCNDKYANYIKNYQQKLDNTKSPYRASIISMDQTPSETSVSSENDVFATTPDLISERKSASVFGISVRNSETVRPKGSCACERPKTAPQYRTSGNFSRSIEEILEPCRNATPKSCVFDPNVESCSSVESVDSLFVYTSARAQPDTCKAVNRCTSPTSFPGIMGTRFQAKPPRNYDENNSETTVSEYGCEKNRCQLGNRKHRKLDKQIGVVVVSIPPENDSSNERQSSESVVSNVTKRASGTSSYDTPEDTPIDRDEDPKEKNTNPTSILNEWRKKLSKYLFFQDNEGEDNASEKSERLLVTINPDDDDDDAYDDDDDIDELPKTKRHSVRFAEDSDSSVANCSECHRRKRHAIKTEEAGIQCSKTGLSFPCPTAKKTRLCQVSQSRGRRRDLNEFFCEENTSTTNMKKLVSNGEYENTSVLSACKSLEGITKTLAYMIRSDRKFTPGGNVQKPS